MNNFPFSQEEIGGELIRVFSPDVEEEELKWHFDLKNRLVKILESNDWQFQLEDSLPTKLFNGQEIYIPQFVWHRVIKGSGYLKVSIKEFD